jgi:hypothetical protein
LVIVREDYLFTSKLRIIFEWIQSQYEIPKQKVVVSMLHQVFDDSLNQIGISLYFYFAHSCIETPMYYEVNIVSYHNLCWSTQHHYLGFLVLYVNSDTTGHAKFTLVLGDLFFFRLISNIIVRLQIILPVVCHSETLGKYLFNHWTFIWL